MRTEGHAAPRALLIPEGRNLQAQCARPALSGVVSVIGLGGMFIRTSKAQPAGTVLKLVLEDPPATFESECTVRHIAENGVGVEITGITPENERRLRALLLHLKR